MRRMSFPQWAKAKPRAPEFQPPWTAPEGGTPFNVRAHTGYASSGPSTSLLGFADGKTARGEFIQVCAECLSPCFSHRRNAAHDAFHLPPPRFPLSGNAAEGNTHKLKAQPACQREFTRSHLCRLRRARTDGGTSCRVRGAKPPSKARSGAPAGLGHFPFARRRLFRYHFLVCKRR